jgi:hypothetical protein
MFMAAFQASTASGFAQAVGQPWPPPQPLSLRFLIQVAGIPSMPVDLSLMWQDSDGFPRKHPPDSSDAPPTKTQLVCSDPGTSTFKAAGACRFTVNNAESGADVAKVVIVAVPHTGRDFYFSGPSLDFDSAYAWHTEFQSQYLDGPGPVWGPPSLPYAFRTQSKPGPPPTKPSINVSSKGSGTSATFEVKGSAFTPGATVTIRVVDDAFEQRHFSQSADGDGKLDAHLSLPCRSGRPLHFSATDNRSDSSDLTGVLWSNIFDIPCP